MCVYSRVKHFCIVLVLTCIFGFATQYELNVIIITIIIIIINRTNSVALIPQANSAEYATIT
jgi:hypothetical protein